MKRKFNKIDIHGDYSILHLSNCTEAIIFDTKDMPKVAGHCWRMDRKNNEVLTTLYTVGKAHGTNLPLRNMIMPKLNGLVVARTTKNILDYRAKSFVYATRSQVQLATANRSNTGYRWIYKRDDGFYELSRPKPGGGLEYGGRAKFAVELLPLQEKWEQARVAQIGSVYFEQ